MIISDKAQQDGQLYNCKLVLYLQIVNAYIMYYTFCSYAPADYFGCFLQVVCNVLYYLVRFL